MQWYWALALVSGAALWNDWKAKEPRQGAKWRTITCTGMTLFAVFGFLDTWNSNAFPIRWLAVLLLVIAYVNASVAFTSLRRWRRTPPGTPVEILQDVIAECEECGELAQGNEAMMHHFRLMHPDIYEEIIQEIMRARAESGD